ncbi:MAG: hypothetical protein RLZZ385_2780 [Pseudomonadota bacterium]|jgi:chorismate--pyruvate lyase
MAVPVSSIDDPALRWQALEAWFPRPPGPWRRWLLDEGSLTRSLQQLSKGDFRVMLVDEGWTRCRTAALLDLLEPPYRNQRMWSRKVVLVGCGQPWVAAHTLVPQGSLDSPLQQVKKLRSRPLGAFLFRHPRLCRSRMLVAPTPAGWGRCSVFRLFDRPILVAEYFLPDLIRPAE